MAQIELKANQAGNEMPAGEALVAVGEKIVEDEIPRDGADGSERLRRAERQVGRASSALKMLKWMAMPVNPTRQNNRKRAETASLVTFAVSRAAKSSAILESSLLSPCWRSRNVDGSSTVRNLPRAVANDIEQDFETLRGEGRRDRLERLRGGS